MTEENKETQARTPLLDAFMKAGKSRFLKVGWIVPIICKIVRSLICCRRAKRPLSI